MLGLKVFGEGPMCPGNAARLSHATLMRLSWPDFFWVRLSRTAVRWLHV